MLQVPVLHTLALWLALAQAGDPVPPERVEPAALPTTPAIEPVMPTDGRPSQAETIGQPIGQSEQDGREPVPAATAPPLRMRKAPSIFTDEAYRHLRVRSLLLGAYDRRR